MFFLAEYANMILIAALTSLMFLGGWLSPFEGTWFESWFAWVPGVVWLSAKISLFLFVFLWLRATFQRYRGTASGISPMAIPGTPGGTYTADGLEHTEAAVPSSNARDHRLQL